MDYHAVVTQMTVLGKGGAIFDEYATTICIDDEAAGPFLIIKQVPDKGEQEIRLTPEEWPVVRDAIDVIFENCKKLEHP